MKAFGSIIIIDNRSTIIYVYETLCPVQILNQELKLLCTKKKYKKVGWGGGSVRSGGSHGGCEPRVEVIVKMPKTKKVGGGGESGSVGVGQGGYELRISYCENAKKKKSRGSGREGVLSWESPVGGGGGSG